MVIAKGAPAARHERYVALDALRGVAAILVVFFHIGNFGWLAGIPMMRAGWLLVDFFFLLSGFVISASYGGRLAKGFPRGRFMALRAGRVLPLHYMVLAIMVLLQVTLFQPVLHEKHAWSEFWRSLFLLDAFRPHTGNWFSPVSWSLAVEMVLYVLAALLFGRGRFGMAVTAVLAAAAAASLWSGFNPPVFGSLLQRGVLAFALGVAAYHLHRRYAGWAISARVLSVAELVVLGLVVIALALAPPSRAWVLVMDAVFLPTVLIFARDGGMVSRVLHANWAEALGRWSFAIYMTHLFVIIGCNRGLPILFTAMGRADLVVPGLPRFGLLSVELGQPAETVLTLALLCLILMLGWLAWRFVEEPSRQWSRNALALPKN